MVAHYSTFFILYRNNNNQTAIDAVNKFATALAARYNPVVGCTRSWDAADPTDFQVIIDNMMNLEVRHSHLTIPTLTSKASRTNWTLLSSLKVLFVSYEYTKNETLRAIAESHANKTMVNHLRPDGTSSELRRPCSSLNNILYDVVFRFFVPCCGL